jgi:mono/diheme cytochrome c family protein
MPKGKFFAVGVMLLFAGVSAAQEFHPDVPRAWDDQAVENFETPLAQRDRSPRYMSAEEYHQLKPRPIYRSYPAYAPGREPAGYREWLKQREPEIIFDPLKLHTKADWIAAGKIVFEADVVFRPAPDQPAPLPPTLKPASDGELPPWFGGDRYYIRKKGVIEVGTNSCADCHTRVMPDGSFFEGGQGDARHVEGAADRLRRGGPKAQAGFVQELWAEDGAPWVQSREEFEKSLPPDVMFRIAEYQHPYVLERQGTSVFYPPHVPSLVGIQDLKYLDSTGLVHHRSIGDIMRYAIANQGLDTLAHYGDFQPAPTGTAFSAEAGTRYSDEQLYAMALYIYSLKPPPNPNPLDDRARRGQKIFEQQGCAGCHTPPLYTSNKLTPAVGFKVPTDLLKSENILNVSVGTDPTLALKTRRGTGFYKVPSLRGVWYRNAFGHNGQAETLEEWFDPARLKDDYVPKGFHLSPGPIKGHEFGLRLSTDDRAALIAFLRTL